MQFTLFLKDDSIQLGSIYPCSINFHDFYYLRTCLAVVYTAICARWPARALSPLNFTIFSYFVC